MQKELLLAIGDERAASYTLRYLKAVYSDFSDLRLTLFYAAPRPARRNMLDDGLTPSDKGVARLDSAGRTKGGKAVEGGLKWLRTIAGCDEEHIRTKIVPARKGVVKELVDEAREGKYDALLLGRRGFSWFEEMFANSVAHELLWHDIDFPLWVCRRPPKQPRRNILLCLDGSDASLRMADHAAYMLDKTDHTFTLFHVSDQGLNTKKSTRLFDAGLAALAGNGIDEERIEMKAVKGGNQVKAILKEAGEGNYLAVGLGRHGEYERNQKQHLFPDSTCVNLLRQMEETALWISK